MPQRLLVSVRGGIEALAAAAGGAQVADVEYPASALGTPYPLNIAAVRDSLSAEGFARVAVSTNIGERQHERANACQAAVGVAAAGADLIKFGLSELPPKPAAYLGREIVRSVRRWFPKKKVIPAVFVDRDLRRFFDPFADGPELAAEIKADGLLVDTFNKAIGRGLLDYTGPDELRAWVRRLHRSGREAWIAGSIQKSELPLLWATGVDVICVRGAACRAGKVAGRFGAVDESTVAALVSTLSATRRRPRN
jgi:(5-formylfuran-3-yl)methyl phosphate synthase